MKPHRRIAHRRIACAGMLFFACSPVLADVTIGTWEGSNTDGWIDWGTQAAIDFTGGKYSHGSSGVTDGSQSVRIDQNGWGQNLAIKLWNGNNQPNFFDYTQFSIDFTVPAQTSSGFTEAYALWINSGPGGFASFNTDTPKLQFGWGPGGGGSQSATLTWDYSSAFDGIAGSGKDADIPTSTYVELILATNGSDAAHGTVFFDNARFTSPRLSVDINGGSSPGTLHPKQRGWRAWNNLPTSGQNGDGAQNSYPTDTATTSFGTSIVSSGTANITLRSRDVGGASPTYLSGATLNSHDYSITGRELDDSGSFTPARDSVYRDGTVAETALTSNGTNHRMEVELSGLNPNTPYKVKFYAYDNANPRSVNVFTDVTTQPLIFMPNANSSDGNFTPGDGSGGTQYAPDGQYINGLSTPTFPASNDFRAIELYAVSDGTGKITFAQTTVTGLSGATQTLPVLNGLEVQPDNHNWTGGGPDWNDPLNWIGTTTANIKGQVANFTTINFPNTTINIDAPTTLGRMNFNATTFTLVGTNPLILDDDSMNSTLTGQTTGRTEINLNGGSNDQIINAPLVLMKDTQVTVANPAATLLISDLQPAAVNLSLGGTGTLRVNNFRTNALRIFGGKVATIPNGQAAGVSRTGNLTISPGARLDLSDNHLITTTAAGSWNGSAYTGVTGLIASGRGTANQWNGATGIITSQTQAVGSNYTSIGVARASDVRPATATATALWAGQTITGTDTLVMYTYGGDATLDGKINIDDYVKIDSGISAGLTGWSNGDFNYDGKVSIDDYITVIDANVGNQSGTFFTSGGIDPGGGSGVAAVPEPASFALIGLSLGAMGLRRRRGR